MQLLVYVFIFNLPFFVCTIFFSYHQDCRLFHKKKKKNVLYIPRDYRLSSVNNVQHFSISRIHIKFFYYPVLKRVYTMLFYAKKKL